ncbi:MAG: BLUF domain-containing protein [Pseudomonadota bacterium]
MAVVSTDPTGVVRPPELVSTLVYTSRATDALDAPELTQLVSAAQVRNAHEHVTGCLVYDQGRFLQWLEGPSDGIDRIAASIGKDERHFDINVLDKRSSDKRSFSEWSMRLLVGREGTEASGADHASDALLETLHRPGAPTTDLLKQLRPEATALAETAGPCVENVDEARQTQRIDDPLLSSRIAAEAPAVLSAAYGAIDGDVERVCQVLRPYLGYRQPVRMVAPLLEAMMGWCRHKWRQDEITEVDVTIAICTALTAFRSLPFHDVPHRAPAKTPVLVATTPGEQHLLQTAVACEALEEEGYAASCDHFETVDELETSVREHAAPLVILCQSGVFRRDERLAALTSALSRARHAGCARAVEVAVLGRSFSDQDGGPCIDGAAFTCRSTSGLVRRLAKFDNRTA